MHLLHCLEVFCLDHLFNGATWTVSKPLLKATLISLISLADVFLHQVYTTYHCCVRGRKSSGEIFYHYDTMLENTTPFELIYMQLLLKMNMSTFTRCTPAKLVFNCA